MPLGSPSMQMANSRQPLLPSRQCDDLSFAKDSHQGGPKKPLTESQNIWAFMQ